MTEELNLLSTKDICCDLCSQVVTWPPLPSFLMAEAVLKFKLLYAAEVTHFAWQPESTEGRFHPTTLRWADMGAGELSLALQLYHLVSTTNMIHELCTIIYSFSLCQKTVFQKVSGIF